MLFMLLKSAAIDQQIIDIHGYKLVQIIKERFINKSLETSRGVY
jgi:hypothetical protein